MSQALVRDICNKISNRIAQIRQDDPLTPITVIAPSPDSINYLSKHLQDHRKAIIGVQIVTLSDFQEQWILTQSDFANKTLLTTDELVKYVHTILVRQHYYQCQNTDLDAQVIAQRYQDLRKIPQEILTKMRQAVQENSLTAQMMAIYDELAATLAKNSYYDIRDFLDALAATADTDHKAFSSVIVIVDESQNRTLHEVGDTITQGDGYFISIPEMEPQPFHVLSDVDPDSEAKTIARSIKAAILAGTPATDIGVACVDFNKYEPLISDALNDADITYTVKNSRSVADLPLARLLICALNADEKGIGISDFCSMLSTGCLIPKDRTKGHWPDKQWLTMIRNGLSKRVDPDDSTRYFERSVLILGAHTWKRLDTIGTVATDTGSESGPGITGTFRDHKSFQEHAQSYRNEAQYIFNLVRRINKYIARFHDASNYRTLLKAISSFLQDVSFGFAQFNRDFSRIHYALASLEALDSETSQTPHWDMALVAMRCLQAMQASPLKRENPRSKGVYIGELDVFSLTDHKLLFICGMREGVFPATRALDPLIDEGVRSQSQGYLPDRQTFIEQQSNLFTKVIGVPKKSENTDHKLATCSENHADKTPYQGIVVSYSRSEFDSNPVDIPSRLIADRIRAIIAEASNVDTGTIPATVLSTRLAKNSQNIRRDATVVKSYLHAVREGIIALPYDTNKDVGSQVLDITEAGMRYGTRRNAGYSAINNDIAAPKELAEDSKFAQIERLCKVSDAKNSVVLNEHNGLIPAVGQWYAKQREDNVAISPSFIDSWLSCPHNCFVNKILHVKPISDISDDDVQIEYRTLGNAVHLIFEKITHQLIAADAENMPQPSTDDVVAIIDEVFDSYEESYGLVSFVDWLKRRKKLSEGIVTWYTKRGLKIQHYGSEIGFGDFAESGSICTHSQVRLPEIQLIKLREGEVQTNLVDTVKAQMRPQSRTLNLHGFIDHVGYDGTSVYLTDFKSGNKYSATLSQKLRLGIVEGKYSQLACYLVAGLLIRSHLHNNTEDVQNLLDVEAIRDSGLARLTDDDTNVKTAFHFPLSQNKRFDTRSIEFDFDVYRRFQVLHELGLIDSYLRMGVFPVREQNYCDTCSIFTTRRDVLSRIYNDNGVLWPYVVMTDSCFIPGERLKFFDQLLSELNEESRSLKENTMQNNGCLIEYLDMMIEKVDTQLGTFFESDDAFELMIGNTSAAEEKKIVWKVIEEQKLEVSGNEKEVLSDNTDVRGDEKGGPR